MSNGPRLLKRFLCVLVILNFLNLCFAFNCKINPDLNKCQNNTMCSETGLCICPQFYYGPNCDILLPDSKSMSIHETGLTAGSFIGIVSGLVVSFPVLLVAGLVLIFYTLKDRDY